MKKKGDTNLLGSNTVEVIIAAIGILLIIIALYLAYKRVTLDIDEENAKTLINNLQKKIELIPLNEKSEIILQGFDYVQGPWLIYGWPESSPDRPNKCYFNSCLCICRYEEKKPSEQCQSQGFCRKVPQNELVVSGYFDSNRVVRSRSAANDYSRIEDFVDNGDRIQITRNLIKVEIIKSNNQLRITQILQEEKEVDSPNNLLNLGQTLVFSGYRITLSKMSDNRITLYFPDISKSITFEKSEIVRIDFNGDKKTDIVIEPEFANFNDKSVFFRLKNYDSSESPPNNLVTENAP